MSGFGTEINLRTNTSAARKTTQTAVVIKARLFNSFPLFIDRRSEPPANIAAQINSLYN
jgi:hypothetical protein